MRMARLGLGWLAIALVGCASFGHNVHTDYDAAANFGQYKTFMWIKEPKAMNPLVSQRVVDDVDAALEAKGLRRVDRDADLGVVAHVATREERTLSTFYDHFGGGWRWRHGFGTATTRETIYEVGTLVVDLFDGRTKEAVWRGTSSKTLSDNPQKNAESLNRNIARMFRDFPPPMATR